MTGPELKKLREALNLTQAQLAEELGYSRQGTISDLENGRCPITKRTAIAVKNLEKQEKKMRVFRIEANGEDLGEYKAQTNVDALNLYAQDAGYANYRAVSYQFGDDAEAFEIDTNALVKAVSDSAGSTVFQDSYGGGVALVGDASYATYQELAESIGKDLSDFDK